MKEEERDKQFHSISRMAGSYLKAGRPVIWSDTREEGTDWQLQECRKDMARQ